MTGCYQRVVRYYVHQIRSVYLHLSVNLSCTSDRRIYQIHKENDWLWKIRPRGYFFFMLISAEHEILYAHKYTNIKIFGLFQAPISIKCYFFLLINCWHFNIYEQEKNYVLLRSALIFFIASRPGWRYTLWKRNSTIFIFPFFPQRKSTLRKKNFLPFSFRSRLYCRTISGSHKSQSSK